MPGTAMSMFTIFRSPLDYPGVFVVREFLILPGEVKPSGNCWVAKTLAQARALVPVCCDTPLARDPADDASVVETWI